MFEIPMFFVFFASATPKEEHPDTVEFSEDGRARAGGCHAANAQGGGDLFKGGLRRRVLRLQAKTYIHT